MNILLVKPRPHKDSINLQSFMLCEPLELEYAAALLKQLGHWADIVDMVLEDDFPAILKTKDYQVVAFTAYQIHVGIVKEYARQVKDNNSSIVTLVGGVHAEVVPEDFDSPFLDVVLTGGMYALEGVIAGIERREGQEELRALGRTPKQLHFRFPHPDRSKTAKYRPHYNYIYHDCCATIKTSFSCPYNCSFCFCTQLGPYFQREMADVLDELEEIQEENIFIVDDDFLFDPQRLEDFCRGLEERGIRKTFLAFGRADFIAEHEELVALLARHGFDAFFVGLESFKEGELEEYQKRTTVEVNNRAVRILEKHGVQCYSGLIVGYDWEKKDFDTLSFGLESITKANLDSFHKSWCDPADYIRIIKKVSDAGIEVASEMIVGADGDTRESLLETVDFIKRTDIVAPKFYCLTPIPGTDLHEEMKAAGKITDYDYFKYKPSISVLDTPNLNATQVTQCYWMVYEKLYTIPAILRRTVFRRRFLRHPGRTLFYLMVNMVYRDQIKRKIAPNIL